MIEAERAAGGEGPRDDESFLDRLLGEFLDELAAGREIDVEARAVARPDLRERIVEVLALASEIALVQPAARPKIAGHEILGELGRGAMGTVYLARQTGLARRVALKVMSSRGAAGSRGRERFLREARAVARLRHDHIVPVHDVGETDGTPWFSMEWIEGRTLADGLARLRALARPPARLTAADLAQALGAALPVPASPARIDATYVGAVVRMVEPLARALAHAHERGVVHRDVKPSNVLVRRDGVALLADFGLAAVEDDASLTLTSGFLGTPHYASPEQARGRIDVDGRSDVYSLGATLYELLTLRRPAEGATTQAVLRSVEHEEPPSPRSLNPALPRDLETIVRAAMEKDPARRYLSAAAFADDLARLLRGEPIAARPVGAFGRALRFVRREPKLATSGALALLILVGTPTGLWLRQSERTAELQRTHAAVQTRARVAGFLEEMLSSLNPDRAKGRTITVREVVDDAARRLDEGLKSEPEMEFELRLVVAGSYRNLGLADAAERHFERALEIARRFDPERPASRALALDGLAMVAFDRADYGRAETLAGDALAALDRAGVVDGVERARVLNDLALTLTAKGEYGRAEPAYRDAIALLRRLGDEREIARSSGNFGQLLYERGRFADAEEPLRESLAILLGLGDPELRDVAYTRYHLALVLEATGRDARARQELAEALPILRKLLGNDDPWTILTLAALANVTRRDESAAAAEPLLREAIALRPALDGRESMTAANALTEIGLLELHDGALADAERDLRGALARFERLVGHEHASTATLLHDLGTLFLQRGRPAEAEASARDALALWNRIGGVRDAEIADAEISLAWCCDARRAVAEGERFARDALDRCTRSVGADSARGCACRDALAWMVHERGADADAEALARENLDAKRRRFGERHAEVARTLGILGEVVEAQKRPDEAEVLYRQAIEIEREKLGDSSLDLATGLHRLGRLLLLRQRLDEAEEPLAEALEIRRELLGDGHLHLVYSLNTVGVLHQLRGEYAAAQPLFEEAVGMSRAVLDKGHPDLGISLSNLGWIKLLRDDPAAAEPLLLEGAAILSKARGPGHPETLAVDERLVRLYRALQEPEKAAPYVALLTAAGVPVPAVH